MKRLSKVIAIVAALVVVMAMSTSVFAAVSPQAPAGTTVKEDVISTNTSEGKEAIAQLGQTEAAVEKNLPDFLEKTFEGVEVPEGATIDVLDMMDLEVTAGDKTPTISFKIDGVQNGNLVYVLHYDGKDWTLYADTADANGMIEITFKDGLSPLYFFVVKQGEKVIALKGMDKPGTLKSYNTGF